MSGDSETRFMTGIPLRSGISWSWRSAELDDACDGIEEER
jgi:hypothetical protein